MRPIKYGLIGCGMMGHEHIRNIQLLNNTAIGAIFEPDDSMRASASALAPEARMVDSLESLLSIEEIDCLVITSPNFTHVSQLKTIADTRPLPVLVEKPLSTDPTDKKIIEALEATYSCLLYTSPSPRDRG